MGKISQLLALDTRWKQKLQEETREQRFKASSEGRGLPPKDDKNFGKRDGEKNEPWNQPGGKASEEDCEGQLFNYLFFNAATCKVKLGGKARLGLHSESFL